MSIMPMPQLSTSTETLQELSALSTRLAWRLFDTDDLETAGKLHELAGEINQLSSVLRQLAEKLRNAGQIASIQAFHDVIALSDQCQAAYSMIHELAPVKQTQVSPRSSGESHLASTALVQRQDDMPSPLLTSEVSFLKAFLNVISCNLGIMSQTFSTAQLVEQSRYDK
jgi:hypothetical protein